MEVRGKKVLGGWYWSKFNFSYSTAEGKNSQP